NACSLSPHSSCPSTLPPPPSPSPSSPTPVPALMPPAPRSPPTPSPSTAPPPPTPTTPTTPCTPRPSAGCSRCPPPPAALSHVRRDLAEGAGGQRQRRRQLRHRGAAGVPRQGGPVQPGLLRERRDEVERPVPERVEGPGGAAELHRQRRRGEAPAGVQAAHQPVRGLRAERRRQRLPAQRPGRHGGVAVPRREPGKRVQRPVEMGEDDAPGPGRDE